MPNNFKSMSSNNDSHNQYTIQGLVFSNFSDTTTILTHLLLISLISSHCVDFLWWCDVMNIYVKLHVDYDELWGVNSEYNRIIVMS